MNYPEFKKTSIVPDTPPTIATDHTKVLLGIIRSKDDMYDKIKDAVSESEAEEQKTAEQWLEWLDKMCHFTPFQSGYVFMALKELTRKK